MNASILRAVLAVALMLGVGIIANVLGQHRTKAERSDALSQTTEPRAATRVKAEDIAASKTESVLTSVRRELVSRGYLASPPTGEADAATRAAILAFEFDHGLILTAEPSEQVQKALIFTHVKAAAAQSVPATDAAQRLVTEVQRALAHLGYASGAPTGVLDEATRVAVRKFERARGLQSSGRISAPLLASLGPAFDATRAAASPTTPPGNAG
ncbi:MAG: peptidoglycan-binding protein [Alphaproteobacteria bacterium]|nr:peptidoglycan-binding protein [Alphaproteobacteria bacterium]